MPTEKAHGYQISQMCQAFVEAGAQTLLLHPYFKNPIKGASIEEYYDLRHPLRSVEIPSLHLNQITNYIPSQALRRFAASVAFHVHRQIFTYNLIRKLKKLINTTEDYIIYVRDGDMARSLISRLPAPHCSRVVVELHSLPQMKVRKHLLAESLKCSLLTVTLTQKTKELLKNFGLYESLIKVCPDGVDIKTFDINMSQGGARKELRIPQDRTVALYVGRFHTMGNEKGIPDIIKASKHLLTKFQNLYFYFVGGPVNVSSAEYDHVGSYRSLIRQLKLPLDRFIFLEKQPVQLIPIWLRSASVLLMPFPRTDHYSFYMSPLKMFEYMTSKRPIVASRLPAIEEILTDNQNALLAEPGNAKEIAHKIQMALGDFKLKEKIATTAYLDVQKYDWRKRALRILDNAEKI